MLLLCSFSASAGLRPSSVGVFSSASVVFPSASSAASASESVSWYLPWIDLYGRRSHISSTTVTTVAASTTSDASAMGTEYDLWMSGSGGIGVVVSAGASVWLIFAFRSNVEPGRHPHVFDV